MELIKIEIEDTVCEESKGYLKKEKKLKSFLNFSLINSILESNMRIFFFGSYCFRKNLP
jgi:hypothetical protein